jgi:hypothetical protein
VSPEHAERALAPSSCGIDSIENPHLNDDPGTIIPFPGEIFRLILGFFIQYP